MSDVPAAPGAPGTGTWRPVALLLALLGSVAVAYSSSIDGGFLFDDLEWISENLAIKDLGRYLRSGFWEEAAGGSGRALTGLTFAVNYAQARLDPRAYHVTSVGLHLAVVVLLWLLGTRLLRSVGWPRPEWPALAAAALWAIHPLNSQAVSYVMQRAEVLAALLYLLAVLLAVVSAERGWTASGWWALAGSLLAALLAFQSKPVVVSLPAGVLAALVVAGLPRRPRALAWRERLWRVAPHLALAILFATGTVGSMAGRVDVGFALEGLAPWEYALTQSRVVLRYIGLLAWPSGLSLDHLVDPSRSLLEPVVLVSASALLALLGGASALGWWATRPGRPPAMARAGRIAAFGVWWFFLLLAPTSSVVPLKDLMFEHRVYLASWGLLLGVVALVAMILPGLVGGERSAGLAGAAVTAVLCLALGLALHQRNRVWSDPALVWLDVIAKYPENPRGYQNLANVRSSRGDHAAALPLLQRAISLGREPVDRAGALRNMGACLLELGRVDEALQALLQAEAIRPGEPGTQNNLAICYLEKGLLGEAEARARQAIQAAPRQANPNTTLGQILAARGDLAGALVAFQQAAALNPDELPPLFNVALANELLGQHAEACQAWAAYGRARGGVKRGEAEARRTRLGCAAPARGR